jgi:hypothetical protein
MRIHDAPRQAGGAHASLGGTFWLSRKRLSGRATLDRPGAGPGPFPCVRRGRGLPLIGADPTAAPTPPGAERARVRVSQALCTVQVKHDTRPAAEVGIAPECPGTVVPGPDRILAEPAPDRGAGDLLDDAPLDRRAGDRSARPPRELTVLPRPAGSEASAFTSATCAGGKRRGRPDRGCLKPCPVSSKRRFCHSDTTWRKTSRLRDLAVRPASGGVQDRLGAHHIAVRTRIGSRARRSGTSARDRQRLHRRQRGQLLAVLREVRRRHRAKTAVSGQNVLAASATLVIGVSAARKAIRQPRPHRADPNPISESSCCSPGDRRTAPWGRHRAPSHAPAPRVAADQVAGEMLLHHADFAALPATPQGRAVRGYHTVFAPTDTAFARVPESTLESLENDRTALRRVLLYRVLADATARRGSGMSDSFAPSPARCVFERAAKAFWYIAPRS